MKNCLCATKTPVKYKVYPSPEEHLLFCKTKQIFFSISISFLAIMGRCRHLLELRGKSLLSVSYWLALQVWTPFAVSKAECGIRKLPHPPPTPFLLSNRSSMPVLKMAEYERLSRKKSRPAGLNLEMNRICAPLQVTCHGSRAGSWSFAFLARETGQWVSFGIRRKATWSPRS